MDKTHSFTPVQISASDTAVDGIFTGIEAGIAMALFLVLVSIRHGLTPTQALASFSLRNPASLAEGLLTHLAVSSIYGILFNLGIKFIVRKRSSIISLIAIVLSGLAFGLFLWLFANFLIFDNTAILLKLFPAYLLVVAHLIYGLTLGLLVQSRHRSHIR